MTARAPGAPSVGDRIAFPVPADPDLLGLADLLDGDRFAASAESALGVGPIEATARSLRYKPSKRAVVLYDVLAAGVRTWAVATIAARKDISALAASPEARRIAAGARSRSIAPEPVHVLDGALVEWYPARLDLPGLASAPDRARAHGGERDAGEPELLVYRPVQRAVLRSGGVYLKAYASPVRYARAVEGFAVAARVEGIVSPSLAGAYQDDRLTVQRALHGEPLPDTPAARELLGEALSLIHASPVTASRTLRPADHLAVARKACEHVARIVPRLGPRASRLLERLAAAEPAAGEPVLSHGDLYERQALATADGIALLDFDSVSMADAAFDFSRLFAHDVYGLPYLPRAFLRLEDALAGYGTRPASLAWYLAVAILRRTTHSLRNLHPEWERRIEAMLDAVEEVAP